MKVFIYIIKRILLNFSGQKQENNKVFLWVEIN